ncbi:ATP-binding protein [candidate division WWE3 bacterium]|nr:ATP-binding protein [candidate division WWE3 bacterium]
MAYLLLSILLLIGLTVLVYKRFLKSHATGGYSKPNLKFLEIQVPRNEETHIEMQTAPLAAENMFAAIHGLLRRDYHMQEHISFEIASSPDGIKFYAVVPEDIYKFVENQIYAHYPTAQIRDVGDYTRDIRSEGQFSVATLRLSKSQIYPISTFKDFEVDPLSAVTSSLAGVMEDEVIWFQFLVKPMPDVWQKEGYDHVSAVRGGTSASPPLFSELGKSITKELGTLFIDLIDKALGAPPKAIPYSSGAGSVVRLSSGQELELKAIENKLSKMGFKVVIRVMSHAATIERVRSNIRAVVASMKQFSTANLNSFFADTAPNDSQGFLEFTNREFDEKDGFVLNTEELGSVFHLPSSAVETPNITWVYSKQSEPPANLPTANATFIGDTIYRNRKIRFGISNTDDRLRHMYLIGKSGTGKSTLFQTLITQDIANGFGVGVLDPHGELIEKVLDYIPDGRKDDVVLIDPSDVERPVGINLLELLDPSQKNLMASALVSAVKVHFEYSWGPRLEYLLNWCILTLLEVEGTTMLGITRLLSDMNYQRYILHQIKDPVLLKFWEQEYKEMRGNQKLVTEAIAPIQNKINRFLSSTTIRNILAQRKSTIDIWDAINSGKILLMNLTKGKIGDDNANLLGALLVSRIQFMAQQRVKIPSEERRPFYLYVDEFQNFATGSFETILSESRKYGLGLYLTHQFTAQLPEELLKAVFGNVGTIASFSLGAPDALVLESEFAPYFAQNDIISLERFHIYLKLMIDGMTSKPFSAKILLPWEEGGSVVKPTGNKKEVVEMSRSKYGVDRAYIEDRIAKWTDRVFDKGAAIAEEMRGKNAEAKTNQNV